MSIALLTLLPCITSIWSVEIPHKFDINFLRTSVLPFPTVAEVMANLTFLISTPKEEITLLINSAISAALEPVSV